MDRQHQHREKSLHRAVVHTKNQREYKNGNQVINRKETGFNIRNIIDSNQNTVIFVLVLVLLIIMRKIGEYPVFSLALVKYLF